MNYDLKPKEYEIMKFIWANANDGVTFGEIHNHVNSLGKQQSRQRVNCFIQALMKKNVLTAIGEERHKIYTPKITKDEYDKQIAIDTLNRLFDGSLKQFVCALTGGETISEEEARELRQILHDKNTDF